MTSAVIVTVFYFTFSSIKAINRATGLSSSMQTVRFVAGRIAFDIEQSGGAGAGSDPGKLVLGAINYEYVSGKVRREEGSDVYNLTDDGEIRGLKFSYPSSKLIGIDIEPKTGGAYHLDVYARN